MRPVRTVPVQYDTFPLAGGLDLVTPTLSLKPGVAREALNFEVSVNGGYSRIAGYERFDGRTGPSSATYSVFQAALTAPVLAGDTITTGGGASGKVLQILGNFVYYTRQVGSFAVGDTILVGGSPAGTVTDLTPDALTSEQQARVQALAADEYRASIAQVPGSGPIRGLAWLSNTLYAWRDNAGGTAKAIYKSTVSGWQLVPLGFELPFDTGTGTAVAVGDTVTNAAGTATGVVGAVALSSGLTWAGGSGRLILTSVTGTWAASDQIRVSGVQRATATAGTTAITIAPGGRVEVVSASLSGNLTSPKLYGADGVGRGFEFDGTTYVPIRVTGLSDAVDRPQHVAVHKNYLFFSFGNSVQNSGIAAPHVWTPVFGANEVALPEDVTGMLSLPSGDATAALLITSRNNTFILYGNTPVASGLSSYDRGAGAAKWSLQPMSDVYMLDDKGAAQLQQSDKFGNFETGTLTFTIQPWVDERVGRLTASGLSRSRSQYRLFYDDGFGLYLTIVNGRPKGAMPVYFPNRVNVWCEADLSSGQTLSFFGSGDDGFVYQMDTGPDFDGASVPAYLTLNFNPQGSARVLKRYRRASLEMQGAGFALLDVGFLLAYDSVHIDQPGPQNYRLSLRGVKWDSFTWDSFTWDDRALAPLEVSCDGTGENIALTVASDSRYTAPFTINSATLHYSVRRGIR